MSEIYQKLQADLKTFRLSKKIHFVNTLRTLVGDIQTLEKRQGSVTDEDCLKVLKKHIDGINENIEICGKSSVIDDEKDWALLQGKQLLETYMPAQMEAEDMAYIMQQEFGNEAPHIGKLFGYFSKNFKGKFDGDKLKSVYHSVYSNG